MKPLVSVIITTKNEEKHIESCLRSIKNQTYPNIEIIVSDSCSSDDTVNIAKKYADKVVVKKTNISEGKNFGAKYAKGKYFVFLDADVILEKKWIRNALKRLHSKNVAMVIGRFNFLENTLRTRIYEWVWKLFLFTCYKIGIPHTQIGCTLGVKRSKFFDVNGFRNDLIIAEDIDFARRIKKMGDIVIEKKCRMLTSTRRLKKGGYVKLSLIWLINGIWYYITKKSLLKYY